MASFKDEVGATRHSMSRNQLEALYKDLENFIADSTREEVKSNLEALNKVKTMIAERAREIKENQESIESKYSRLKKTHPEAVLLFRMNAFYISINEDAESVSKTLGTTLISNKGRKESYFPQHLLDTYLPKLVRSGFRVAICD